MRNDERNTQYTEIGYVPATERNETILLQQLMYRAKSPDAKKYNYVLRYSTDLKRITIVRITRRLKRKELEAKQAQRKMQNEKTPPEDPQAVQET